VHAAHDSALKRAFEAPRTHDMPEIQVAASEGKLLELLTRLSGGRTVVEVGTLAGYSALRIARGLAPGGALHTIELEAKHAEVARDNLAEAGLADRVTVHVGAALEVLPKLEAFGPFDLVFLDADKEGYPEYAAWAAKHLRSGGLLVADNAYFFNQLLADSPAASAMRRFHEALPLSFDSVCIPTPDGLVLALRR
jgi:caffeoyl-CoA O-methyltransferase